MCASAEIILFQIMHKDKLWLNVGKGLFVSRMKFGNFNKIHYCIDTTGDHVFYKKSLSNRRCLHLQNTKLTQFIYHHIICRPPPK